MPGEFYLTIKKENIKAGTIVLYLKTICKHKHLSDYLQQVFAHEAFNAYHWISCNIKTYTSWKHSDYQYDTVKEGLAKYFEHHYIKSINKELANEIESDLKNYEMNEYPYAAFNYMQSIKRNY